ncbi:hypothetical protein Tco_1503074 [Tanacetum coccineum]
MTCRTWMLRVTTSFEHVGFGRFYSYVFGILGTYEDLSDIGSPGAEGPIFQDPPSPDYVPGPEEPEQAPPSPIYVPFVPEPVYPEFLPEDDVLPAEEQPLPVAASPTTESPGYIPESDPEEDPEEDDEEDCGGSSRAYLLMKETDKGMMGSILSATDDDMMMQMSIRPQALTPFLFEEVAERLGRVVTTPGLDTRSGTGFGSWLLLGQVGLPQARADLYGFTDMLDAAPGCQTSRELGYGITDTWDDLEDDYLIYSQLDDARYDRALLRARVNMVRSEALSLLDTGSGLSRPRGARYRRRRRRQTRQQGPAKDPAEPELPEEASSSS